MPYADDPDQLTDLDYVCGRHLGADSYLEQLVNNLVGDGEGLEPCALCSNPGWDVDGILPTIVRGVTKFYERAADSGMMFEDGDFVGHTSTTEEVLDDVGIEFDHPLRRASIDRLGDDAWVSHDHDWPSEYRLLTQAWQAFSDHVKHHSRFLFRVTPTTSYVGMRDQLGTSDFLADLGSEIDDQPRHVIDASTELYRARSYLEGSSWPAKVADYSAPPREMASQGRMNPAGIAFFYGALDPATAAAEVHAPDSLAAVATFNPLRPLTLVDLTAVTLPSPFDDRVEASTHHRRLFMHGFVAEISKPIVRDNRVHYEYVPTQAVTEYIRYRSSPPPDGIMFSSARAHGTNVVIFADHEGCLGAGQQPTLTGQASVQLFRYDPPSVTATVRRSL